MNCPFCKTRMWLVKYIILMYKDSIQKLEFPYWKCPECKEKIDEKETK